MQFVQGTCNSFVGNLPINFSNKKSLLVVEFVEQLCNGKSSLLHYISELVVATKVDSVQTIKVNKILFGICISAAL